MVILLTLEHKERSGALAFSSAAGRIGDLRGQRGRSRRVSLLKLPEPELEYHLWSEMAANWVILHSSAR